MTIVIIMIFNYHNNIISSIVVTIPLQTATYCI